MGDCTSIKPTNLTFEDLRSNGGTGRAYTISGSGRNRVTGYRNGISCKLGDIELSEWINLVKDLIVQTGEQELYQQLLSFVGKHNHAKASKSELEKEALELHAARIFDNPLWVNFIAFNEQFRPEVLRSVRLISVLPDCCKRVGLITEASYLEYNPAKGENFCPHCRRWTKISLVDDQTSKGDDNNDQ